MSNRFEGVFMPASNISAPTRNRTSLNSLLDNKLLAYASAAGAAGVGLLALAQPAEASVVFKTVHLKIGPSTFIDLDGDGVKDFEFQRVFSTLCEGSHCGRTQVVFSYGHLYASGANAGNQVWGQGNVVSQLAAGVSVGPNGQFAGGR